jgi:hypothetical protein
VAFATLALAVASAKTYEVTLFQPSTLNGKELKAGDYKVEVDGSKTVLRKAGQSTEAAVKVETGDQKFSATSVRYSNGDGKYRIQEIRLGETNTKLVVNE